MAQEAIHARLEDQGSKGRIRTPETRAPAVFKALSTRSILHREGRDAEGLRAVGRDEGYEGRAALRKRAHERTTGGGQGADQDRQRDEGARHASRRRKRPRERSRSGAAPITTIRQPLRAAELKGASPGA